MEKGGRLGSLMPKKREEYKVNPIPSTLVILAHEVNHLQELIKKNNLPSPIDFKIYETLEGRIYRLTGIVMVRNWHYTTIAYVPEKKQWFNFNDEKVRPIGGEPSLKNLADSRNVPLLFFYTLQENQENSKRKASFSSPTFEKKRKHNPEDDNSENEIDDLDLDTVGPLVSEDYDVLEFFLLHDSDEFYENP